MGLFNFFKKKKVISYSKEELDTVLRKYFNGDKRFWAQEAVFLGRPYHLKLKTEMSLLLNSMLIYEFYSNVDEKELMERLLNNNYAKVSPEVAIKFFHDAIEREVPTTNDNMESSSNPQKKFVNIYSPKGTNNEDKSEDDIDPDNIIPLEHPIMLAIFKDEDLRYIHREGDNIIYTFQSPNHMNFKGEDTKARHALSAGVFFWLLYYSRTDVAKFDKTIGIISHSYSNIGDLVLLSATKTAGQCIEEVKNVFPSFNIQFDFSQHLGFSQRVWLEVMALDRFINRKSDTIMNDKDFISFMTKGGPYPSKMIPRTLETEDDIYYMAVYEFLTGKVKISNNS